MESAHGVSGLDSAIAPSLVTGDLRYSSPAAAMIDGRWTTAIPELRHTG